VILIYQTYNKIIQILLRSLDEGKRGYIPSRVVLKLMSDNIVRLARDLDKLYLVNNSVHNDKQGIHKIVLISCL